MKKTIIILFTFLLISNVVYALSKGQSFEIQDAFAELKNGQSLAQEFSSQSGTLANASFYLKKDTSINEISVSIWTTLNNKPNVRVENCTNIDASSIPTSFTWINSSCGNFNFSSSTSYAYVLNYDYNLGGIANWGMQTSGTYSLGDASYSGNNGTSWTSITWDMDFINWLSSSISTNNTIPIINVSYPLQNEHLDNSSLFPIKINGTAYVQNGSIQNLTINNTNFKNFGNQTNFNFSFNGSYAEGKYSIRLTANSTHGNVTEYNLTFFIDNTNPVIRSSLSNNGSLFYIYSNVSFTVNLSDNTLVYSVNVSTPEGYAANLTNIDQETYLYNVSFNTSAYTLGRHNVTIFACDAHTAKQIGQYDIVKDTKDNSLDFDFGKGDVSVLPETKTDVSNFEYEKLSDRYIFKYTKSDSEKDTYSFIVESTHKIDIIGNKKGFNGWLVISDLNKWIDFNSNLEGLEYQIDRISDKKVKITIYNINQDNFEFHSIGDLNCMSETYLYYLFNYTPIYDASVVETTLDTIRLVVDLRDILVIGNGSLVYGSNEYSAINKSSAFQMNLSTNFTTPAPTGNSSTYTFYFNLFFNNSLVRTINFSQTVNAIQLATCGDLTDVKTINISIFNEQNPTEPLNANLDTTFSLWTNNSGNRVNFTFSLSGQTNYSICIYPNTSVNVDASMFYNTSGGYTQRWFLTEARLNQITQKINLFNFKSTTGLSELRATIRDTGFDPLENIIVKLLKYYPSENLWRTVQMDRSDDFGQTIYHVTEQSQDYILVFEKDGSEITRTSTMKFLCASSICTSNFVVNPSSSAQQPNLQMQYAYNNISQMYQLNYSDTTGLTHSVRLKVTKENPTGSTTICDVSSDSSTGTLSCNTSGYTGQIVAKVYRTQSPEIPIFIDFISKFTEKIYQNIGRGESGIWAIGISSTLIMAGAMFSGVAAIILTILSLVFISWLGLLNFVTMTLIAVLACVGILIASLLRR